MVRTVSTVVSLQGCKAIAAISAASKDCGCCSDIAEEALCPFVVSRTVDVCCGGVAVLANWHASDRVGVCLWEVASPRPSTC